MGCSQLGADIRKGLFRAITVVIRILTGHNMRVSVYISAYIQHRIPLGHYQVGTEEGPESSTVWDSPGLFDKTVKGL